jgi:LmbE family N-acetylglucosaminyl deacetylase
MKILVIAPHPDDESLGCGGAISLHAQRRDEVNAAFLTSGELGLKKLSREEAWKIREAEARASCKVLGIQEANFLRLPDWTMSDEIAGAAGKLRTVLQNLRPEMIYLPHPREWHPDHQAALPVLRAALENAPFTLPKLRGYEVWTPLTEYQHVEDITPVMARKLRALRKHASQMQEWDYVRAIRGLNAYRGVMAGRCDYAEVFQELSLAP